MAAGFKKATVNAAAVPSTQTNFPSYVDLSRLGITTLAEAQSVRVYSDLGKTTEWAREIVSATEMHVKVPNLTSTVTMYVDWDGIRSDYSATDTYGRNAVWSDYEAVYHLESLTADSTASGHNLTAVNSPTNPTAKLNKGVGLNTAWFVPGQEHLANDSAALSTGNSAQTMTCWVKIGGETTVDPQNGDFVHFWNKTATGSGLRINYEHNGGTRRLSFIRQAGAGVTIFVNGSLGTANWYKLTIKFDGTNITGYKNATPTSTTASSGTADFTIVPAIRIGSNYWTDSPWATVDEVRLRKSAVSDNWETTEYNNQNDEATFWGTWSPAKIGTNAVTDITAASGLGNGEVVSDGGATIIERGVVWSTSPNPTTANNKATTPGTLGVFSVGITGLLSNTTYYVRAFYTNSLGTTYGNEVSFTTLAINVYELQKDIGASQGDTFVGQINVTGTLGTVTVRLGTTGSTTVINAGSGPSIFTGTYSGLSGLIITRSADFNGTIDNVYYTEVPLGTTVDFSLDSAAVITAIDSSVFFKRIEDDIFNSFAFYRYLDILFKDLDGFVTVTVRDEREDISTDRTKTFSVGNTSSGTVSPFQKKRISFIIKNQAVIIGVSNANLNETFSIAQFVLTGHQKSRKMFSSSNIISMS